MSLLGIIKVLLGFDFVKINRDTYYKGHRMFLDKSIQEWRYKDDRSLVKDNWQLRPCGYCQKYSGVNGHDPCLGMLNGVMNACCGHGNKSFAYVQFDDGNTVSGEKAIFVICDLLGISTKRFINNQKVPGVDFSDAVLDQ